MGAKTAISWTDATWSPLRAQVRQDAREIAIAKGYTSLLPIIQPGRIGPHCERVSPECDHCYSETNNKRCLPYNGTGLPFDRRSRDLVEMIVDEKVEAWPRRWREPKRIFVESQSDLFGEFVPDGMVLRIFTDMWSVKRHTYQVLTKRAERAAFLGSSVLTPQPHIWMGFSAGNQEQFDARWRHMRKLADAGWLVFCSAEPLLGPIDMRQALKEGLRWVIPGGESGAGARACRVAWVRSIVSQCGDAGVACFVKQLGRQPSVEGAKRWDKPAAVWRMVKHPNDYRPRLKSKSGADPAEWPKDLRVQQFPKELRA
jgi:protein gp37